MSVCIYDISTYSLNFDELRSLKLKYGEEKCVFIGILGKYRVGKSSYINMLYSLENKLSIMEEVFPSAFGEDSVTKGICISKKPLKKSHDDINVFFIDSQGVSATDMKRANNFIYSFMISFCDIILLNVDKNLMQEEVDSIDLNVTLGVDNPRDVAKKSLVVLKRNSPERKEDNDGKLISLDSKKIKNIDRLTEPFRTAKQLYLPYPGRRFVSVRFSGKIKDIDDEFIEACKVSKDELYSLIKFQDSSSWDQVISKLEKISETLPSQSIMCERSDLELNNLLKVKKKLEIVFKNFANHDIFRCEPSKENYEIMKSKRYVLYNEYMTKFEELIRPIQLHKDDAEDLKVTSTKHFENYYQEKLESFENIVELIMQKEIEARDAKQALKGMERELSRMEKVVRDGKDKANLERENIKLKADIQRERDKAKNAEREMSSLRRRYEEEQSNCIIL